MPDDNESKRDLEHELANSQAKVRAAQHLLKRAADEIENIVQTGCADEDADRALEAARRFRKAATH
jgi:hypothetical protein